MSGKGSLQWIPYELHTHTFHSDGKHSLEEMAQGARALGIAGLALTDHNTMTALMKKEAVTSNAGVQIISGLEWTTFFGHMLALGITDYVDWRDLSPFHLHRGIEAVHRQGGIVGMAHPFRVGSPMCTGCFWEFEIADWREIDYIEVWSGTFPSIRRNNARAFALWTDRLNAGFRVSATSGRDWHSLAPVDEPVCSTFLGTEGGVGPRTAEHALAALKRGAAAVSMGPLPILALADRSTGAEYGIGEAVPAGTAGRLTAKVAVDGAVRRGHWTLPPQTLELRLVGAPGVLAAVPVAWNGESVTSTEAELTLAPAAAGLSGGFGWLRAELYGTFHGVRTMIGFTNPIYEEKG